MQWGLRNCFEVWKDLEFYFLEQVLQPDHLRMLLLQPKRRLPAPTTFPSSPAEVLHVILGREPIVTDDPTENPLQ